MGKLSVSVVTFIPLLLMAQMETFDFLNLPNGARYAGLAGCSMGIIGDPFATFSNPACLQGEIKRLGFNYTNYVAGIKDGSITFVSPGLGGNFGIGIAYLNSGKITLTDENGVELGTYFSQSITPTFGYARSLGSTFIGVSCKGIYQTIEKYTSTGVAINLGCLYYPKEPWEGAIIGGTVQNVGFQITGFDEEKEKLPFFARIGITYPWLDNKLHTSIEIEFPYKYIIVGIEWKPVNVLTLRGGYYSWGKDLEVGGNLDIFAGKTFGLGIKTAKYQLDYAVTPKVELGVVHRISITYPFVEGKAESPLEEKEKPQKEEELPKEEEEK